MSAHAAKSGRADRIADTLKQRILSGVYPPGAKLQPEPQLAAELGVNRFTVREALNRLEGLRLIERKPGVGTVVLDYTQHASLDVIESLVVRCDGTVNTELLDNLLEVARLLSSELAGLAAQRRQADDLQKLGAIVSEMQREQNLSKLLWLDFDFNWALAGAARNIVPRLLLTSVRGLLEKYTHLLETLWVSPGSITEGYEHVVAAVRAQDPERARSLVKWIWTDRHHRYVEAAGKSRLG